jgi:hypothetical protein
MLLYNFSIFDNFMQLFALDIRFVLLPFLSYLWHVYRGMLGKHLYKLNVVFSDVSMVVTKYVKITCVKQKHKRNCEWNTLRNK